MLKILYILYIINRNFMESSQRMKSFSIESNRFRQEFNFIKQTEILGELVIRNLCLFSDIMLLLSSSTSIYQTAICIKYGTSISVI